MKRVAGIAVLLLVIMATSAIIEPTFLNPYNIKNILRWTGLFGLLSLGEAFVIMTGGIDLSVGSIVEFIGAFAAHFLMGYKIVYGEDVIKTDFASLDNFTRQRVIKEVAEKLSVAPNQFGLPLRRELKGYRRLRIGDYRVIYRVDNKKATVLIVMVSHRRSKYKGVAQRIGSE